MRCVLRPLLRAPRLRLSLAATARVLPTQRRCAASSQPPRPERRSWEPRPAHQRAERRSYISATPLLLAAAAVGVAASLDDDEDEDVDGEEDEDDDGNEVPSFMYSAEELEDDSPLEFRERYMRLKDAKRWVQTYAEHKQATQVVEAFVPILLDVQERVMDVANVGVADFADMYFYAGFFASVLVDLPVDQIVAYVERISDGLSRYPERQQAARMMLVYTAMLTKEPALVKWFNDNAFARLNREPRYAGQPDRIRKQIKILLAEIEQQLNENWAIIASGHFIATRNRQLLREVVEALDLLVKGGQGQVPLDAVQEALVRTCDREGVAARAFARMDLSERTPEVRDSIRQIVRAYGLKMRPPKKKRRSEDDEDE